MKRDYSYHRRPSLKLIRQTHQLIQTNSLASTYHTPLVNHTLLAHPKILAHRSRITHTHEVIGQRTANNELEGLPLVILPVDPLDPLAFRVDRGGDLFLCRVGGETFHSICDEACASVAFRRWPVVCTKR